MFSGICGFEKGIEDAKVGWKCVGRSEVDKYAESIAKYHYPTIKNFGDATRIIPEELPDFDCIVGGFPCQSFSIAGKRGAFSDIRGTLFFEICRIAGIKKPAYLFLENVKGLLSAPYTEAIEEWDEADFNENGEPTESAKQKHKQIPGTKGWVFLTILNTLWELGYDCQWQVLDSQYHGVAQHRERVYIIANLRDKCRQKIFPIGEVNTGNIESQHDDTETQISRTITNRFRKGVGNTESRIIDVLVDAKNSSKIKSINELSNRLKFIGGLVGEKNKLWLEDGKDLSRNFPQGQRVYDINGISAQLTSQGGGWGAKTGLYAIPILTPDRPKGRQNGRKFKTNGEPMFTLIGMDRQGVIINSGIRRLTPTECERLQGFPDSWTKYGLAEDNKTIEISDNQRYKCCGNAVTTNTIRDIVLKWMSK